VTAIDGYQMARQGKAGPALATAALGSFFAGTVATGVLVLFAPPLAAVALEFGPPEYFSLIVLGLIASIALAHGSIIKALAMIVLGLLLGMIGQDIYTGTPRFTFGIRELYSGVNFVSVAVGVFGVAEILRNLENEKDRTLLVKTVTNLWLSREDFRRIAAPVVRGTILGSLLGILPGGGHVLAAFAAYSLEKRASREPEKFGHGAIEGVAGPESANNAAAQTSFIPLLTLGLPAHPVMALMVGAFIIQGITPGPNVITDEPALFWGLIVSMWVGNLLLVLLNLPLIGLWVKMLTIPYNVLFPAIIAFACIGCYSINLNVYHVYAIAFFGILGYVLVKLGCEPAPLLLGFVLGPLLEEHLRRAMIISRGDPTIFLTRPISAVLLVLAAAALAVAVMPTVRKKREEVFQEED
jgi:TctA family transporter